MNPITSLHRDAMEYSVMADVSDMRGRPDEAEIFYQRAFELEKQATALMPNESEEPLPRHVMLRSTAAMAYKAGKLEEAEKIIADTLAENPPTFVVQELKDISKLIKKAKTNPRENGHTYQIDRSKSAVYAKVPESKILFTLGQIEKVNKMLASHLQRNSHETYIVESLQKLRQEFVQQLAELLNQFEVEVQLTAAA